MRPQEAEDWLRLACSPWLLPRDPIDSAQLIALLNGGVPLRASTREYKAIHARIAKSGLRTWRLLGQDRYERAEGEQLAALWAARGITTERISQSDKGSHSLATAGRVDSRSAGEKLGRLRKSGEPLDDATVARMAPEIPGSVKLGHRWWFDEEQLESWIEKSAAAGDGIHEPKRDRDGEIIGGGGGKVVLGCAASGCIETFERPWSELYEMRDGEIVKQDVFVYCSVEH